MYINGDELGELFGIKQDVDNAVTLFHRDAELGFAPAYQCLGIVYGKGDGVSKGKKKARWYHELAAIAGCVKSRLILALYEREAGVSIELSNTG